MSSCTFFGHKDTPKEIEPTLRSTLIDLIENKCVDKFYIGNNGNFDYLVKKNLKLLTTLYPHIQYVIVLAYLQSNNTYDKYPQTIYPEGLEHTPPKYAIIQRNIWMIDHSDYVVTYVKHIGSNSVKLKEIAEKKGKFIINL